MSAAEVKIHYLRNLVTASLPSFFAYNENPVAIFLILYRFLSVSYMTRMYHSRLATVPITKIIQINVTVLKEVPPRSSIAFWHTDQVP